MSATKSKKSKSAKQSQPSPEKIKIGGAPQKDLSKLYAALALAPENKKFLIQRIIDRLENKKS